MSEIVDPQLATPERPLGDAATRPVPLVPIRHGLLVRIEAALDEAGKELDVEALAEECSELASECHRALRAADPR